VKLFGVETVDVRGLANRQYSFARSPEDAHDRVLIRGGPCSGKTRLIEVIVAARELLAIHEEMPEHATLIQPGNKTSKVILSWLLTPEEQATIGAPTRVVVSEIIFGAYPAEEHDSRIGFLLERYDHEDSTPKVEYFSAQRRLDLGGGDAGLDEYAQVQLRSTMSPTPRKFSWLPGFLARLPDQPAQAARFARSLANFSSTCEYDLARHALTSRGRVLRGPRELSASETDAVTISATATLVGLSGSIVLIDRPDLYGIDAARAMAGLSGLGRDNQLIIATDAPELATGFDGAIITLGAEG
jgi:hypothetical protein